MIILFSNTHSILCDQINQQVQQLIIMKLRDK